MPLACTAALGTTTRGTTSPSGPEGPDTIHWLQVLDAETNILLPRDITIRDLNILIQLSATTRNIYTLIRISLPSDSVMFVNMPENVISGGFRARPELQLRPTRRIEAQSRIGS